MAGIRHTDVYYDVPYRHLARDQNPVLKPGNLEPQRHSPGAVMLVTATAARRIIWQRSPVSTTRLRRQDKKPVWALAQRLPHEDRSTTQRPSRPKYSQC